MEMFWSSESREEKLNHIEERITDAIENLDSAVSKLRIPTQSEGLLHVIDCLIE